MFLCWLGNCGTMYRMILTDQQIAPIDVQTRRNSDFGAGDTVRVHQKITEKGKTRIQVFEGTVIARKHGVEPGATFTVRRVGTDGIAVEKIFPLYTPTIDRIEVVQKVKTRRAKLYFLRGRTPKQIREKLRNTLVALKDAVAPEPKQEGQSKKSESEQQDEQSQQVEMKAEKQLEEQDEQPKQTETKPETQQDAQPKQKEKESLEQPTDTKKQGNSASQLETPTQPNTPNTHQISEDQES